MQLIREHARQNNATVIIIAHRYATVREVDELLVLEAGKSRCWKTRRTRKTGGYGTIGRIRKVERMRKIEGLGRWEVR